MMDSSMGWVSFISISIWNINVNVNVWDSIEIVDLLIRMKM